MMRFLHSTEAGRQKLAGYSQLTEDTGKLLRIGLGVNPRPLHRLIACMYHKQSAFVRSC